ncbi:MAG: hypothetical protein JNM93_05755 [Bacteriovoracaceae bacterium]|nr:hypothetical protein [Bacteriovoracaceae bacterium]
MMFFLLLFISFKTYAHSLIMEPFAGYNFYGKSGYAEKYDTTGYTYGGRFGYTNKGVFALIDFNLSQLDRKVINESAFANELGLVLGMKFSLDSRAWAGAVIAGVFEDDEVGTLKGANGYKFGLGHRIYDYLYINFEVKTMKYNSYDAMAFSDFRHSTATLTLSYAYEVEIKKVRKYFDF